MRQEIIEQEVAALWVRYSVIEKMSGTYSDCIENRACDPIRRIISADLEDTPGQIPRVKQAEREPTTE
ncbi:MAG: hypothetical protein NTV68_06635 [Methanomicrobiales archaeon]|nr:hypothetical protein [Methanomicrobiales archaeon]